MRRWNREIIINPDFASSKDLQRDVVPGRVCPAVIVPRMYNYSRNVTCSWLKRLFYSLTLWYHLDRNTIRGRSLLLPHLPRFHSTFLSITWTPLYHDDSHVTYRVMYFKTVARGPRLSRFSHTDVHLGLPCELRVVARSLTAGYSAFKSLRGKLQLRSHKIKLSLYSLFSSLGQHTWIIFLYYFSRMINYILSNAFSQTSFSEF